MRELRSNYERGSLLFYVPGLTPRPSLWQDCPLPALLSDPTIGHMDWEQFKSFNAAASTGDWVVTQATNGAAALSAAEGGVLEVDSDSTTATQGANVQKVRSAFVPSDG